MKILDSIPVDGEFTIEGWDKSTDYKTQFRARVQLK